MSKFSKVKSVEVGASYESKHGTMINHNYTMEDGQKIQASHKTKLPIKVGENVEYSVLRTHPTYGDGGTVSAQKDGKFNKKTVKQTLEQTKRISRSNALHAMATVNSTYAEERISSGDLHKIETFTVGDIQSDIDKFGRESDNFTSRLSAVKFAAEAAGYKPVSNIDVFMKFIKWGYDYIIQEK